MTTPEPVAIINGERWWAFLYEYDWDGATYGFEVRARTREEADARLKRLPLARYVGQGDGEGIPAHSDRGIVWLYVSVLTWWRNLSRGYGWYARMKGTRPDPRPWLMRLLDVLAAGDFESEEKVVIADALRLALRQLGDDGPYSC